MPDKKTVILGPEYDQELLAKLQNVLTALGAVIHSDDWGVGGSQELREFDVKVSGTLLHIESETYVGLSVQGDGNIVDKVSQMMIE